MRIVDIAARSVLNGRRRYSAVRHPLDEVVGFPPDAFASTFNTQLSVFAAPRSHLEHSRKPPNSIRATHVREESLHQMVGLRRYR